MPHNFLSGLSYPVLGRYEESGEEGKKQLGRLRTMRSPRRPSRIATLVRINRRRPLAHKQWKHKLNHAVFAAAPYEIAFLQNDVTGMQADVPARDGQSRPSLSMPTAPSPTAGDSTAQILPPEVRSRAQPSSRHQFPWSTGST